jgi:hypothetical protein
MADGGWLMADGTVCRLLKFVYPWPYSLALAEGAN